MPSRAALELLIQLRDEASSGIGNLTSMLAGLGTAGLAVAAAGVAALGTAIVGGVGDAQEARQLYASTQQTIETMGNAAGRSADQVTDLASNLSDAAGMSLFGDDQIQQSENLLLTFGNIKGETFDLATALTVDLAQALGGAPKDQAMMLGKALNDPIKGITALGKAGLTFSEEQKAAIAAMVETGDMAGAQALIIKELNTQVGGQAQAAAQAAGGMVQFKASLGETFETIGGKLLPILDKFGAWLNSPDVKATIEALATALADGIGTAAAWLSDVAIPALMQAWEDMEPTVMSTIAFIQSDVVPVLAWIANVLIAGLILELQALAWAWTNILLPNIKIAVDWFQTYLLPILSTIFVALRDDLPRGIAVAVQAWDNFKTALASFKETYIDPIINGFNFVVTALTNAQAQFDAFINGVTNAIIPDWLQGHSPPPMADWFDSIGQAAADSGGAVDTFIGKLKSGAIDGIKDFLGGGGGPSVGIDQSDLERYLQAVRETGDVSNDFLTEMPKEAWNAVREMGRTFSAGNWWDAVAPPAGTLPSLPAFGAAGAAGGAINVYVTVQGNVTTERDLVLAIRDGLNAIGRQNVTIFAGQT